MKKDSILRTFIAIYILLQVFPLFSLDPRKSIDFYCHQVWTVEEGLPMNSVITIAQTTDGYLWLGTETGLARFDGLAFDIFNKENTPQLAHNLILSLVGSRDGGLWIGTRGGGLIYYKQGTFKNYNRENGLLSNEVWALLESGDGALWIGTRNGLYHLGRGTLSQVRLPAKMTSYNIRALMEDHLGRIWAGTYNSGLIMIEKRGTRFETEFKGMTDLQITSLHEDRDGIIRIGTYGQGLFRLKEDSPGERQKPIYTTQEGLSNNFVRCLMEDKSGNIWIGCYGGGICVKKSGTETISIYNKPGDLSSNSIYVFFEDREGTFWIGTEGGGLNSLKESRLVTFTMKNGLSYDIMNSVFQDSRGDVWFCNMGFGADCFDLKTNHFRHFSTSNGLSSNLVVSIAEYPRDNLWLGTLGGGINLLDLNTKHIRSFTKQDGLSDNFIRALYVDPQGTLWAGADNGGLHRYSNGRFTLYRNVGFRINTIFKDSRGGLWVGTWGGGLFLFREPGESKAFNKGNGLSDNTITSFYEDNTGALWIGTYGDGLNRFNGKRFEHIAKKDGLPDNTVYCILEDEKHYLWMSTNQGIAYVLRKELEDFLAGRNKSILPSLFTTDDGMKSIECNGGNYPSGWKTRDGRLWFPTTKGVSVVDPGNIGIDSQEPPVMIKQVTINSKDYDVYKKAILPNGEGNLEIVYTGPSSIAPKKIVFKYCLEGYENAWHDAGKSRKVSYTGLPYGLYRFRVIACNRDGIWNNTGASFEFYMKPNFYQTLTFYFVFPLFLIAIGVTVYFSLKKYRSSRKLKNKYRSSNLKPGEAKEYLRKMLYLIEVENVYKDSELSLQSLSKKLSVSPRILSQIINEQMKKNFYELINHYRVEEAKKMLTSPSKTDLSILEIGFEVGFSSKSALNRAFKHFTKQTPSEYRERYKSSNT